MALEPGVRLGPYEIHSAIGAGGMGEVYKARDTRLDRTVAIKILPAALAADPQFRERFDREARAISQLTHPHICTLYDVGEQTGTAYLVMELLEGETLARRLERSALPLPDALTTAIQIAGALDRAHRAGITHRDLKPGNIMLTKSGAKLLDFGLAKVSGATGMGTGLSMMPTTAPNLTAEGTILGTLQYMAPEQLEGQEADTRTDIFAFGAVLYEMLTGKTAFHGKTQASLIAAILEHEPPPLSTAQHTSPALAHIVTRCLAKQRDERWQSAGDVCRELQWAADTPVAHGTAATNTSHKARNAAVAAAVALTLAVLAVTPAAVRHWREPVTFPRPVRFTIALPGGAALAALPTISVSPDGRSIAFSARAAGSSQVFVHRLDERESRPLPGTGGASNGDWPIWSPDGGSLVFRANGLLKRIDVQGGLPISLGALPPTMGSAVGGTWGPNGDILLAGAIGGIMRLSATGGIIEPVPLAGSDSGFDLSPVFLPDGRRFLFSRQGGAEPGVYLGALDSREVRKLVPSGGTVQIADGFLLYSEGTTVFAQPFDVSEGSVTGEPSVVAEGVTTARSGRAAFAASQNGVLAYAGTGSQSSQLTWFSRTGQRLGTVGDIGPDVSVALSPDQRRVAFQRRDNLNDRTSVWAIDVDRQIATRLTSAPSQDQAPRWSPDGTRLMYHSFRDGDQSLYEIAASGGPSRLVLKAPPSRQLLMDDWSADGGTILYHTDMPAQLWALTLRSDPKPLLVQDEARGLAGARFSPDGKWVAVSSSESGTYQVHVVPFPPTGAKWQVSANGGTVPEWRSDGRELYFLSDAGSRIMAADVRPGAPFEAGTPHALFQVTASGEPTGSRIYAVSPDGQRFLVRQPAEVAQATAIQVIIDWPGLFKKN